MKLFCIKKLGVQLFLLRFVMLTLPYHSNMKNDYFLQIQTTQIHAVRRYILKRQLEGSSYIKIKEIQSCIIPNNAMPGFSVLVSAVVLNARKAVKAI